VGQIRRKDSCSDHIVPQGRLEKTHYNLPLSQKSFVLIQAEQLPLALVEEEEAPGLTKPLHYPKPVAQLKET
jgi:hypothetical protein